MVLEGDPGAHLHPLSLGGPHLQQADLHERIVLPRAVLIRGKVTEVGSGKPVAGAVVRDTKGLWTNPTASTRATVRTGRRRGLGRTPANRPALVRSAAEGG